MKKQSNKRKLIVLAAMCSTALVFAACQGEHITSTENGAAKQEANLLAVTPSPAENENSSNESQGLFSDLAKYQFVFSSGVGGWQTMLNVNADGSFTGDYYDSDMGDAGEKYPNGTVYSSTFKGKFTKPIQVNEYTYAVSIEAIELEQEIGSEEIVDGFKYILQQTLWLR